MRIGGLQKFSLIDYPGKMAAVVFTQGCNFRCPYCHNSELVLPEKFGPPIPEEDVIHFLDSRQGYLEGVVVTGGEPTQQADLISFLDKIRQMGFLVKLDTNGSHPKILTRLIHAKLVDYIAMDIKAPLAKYSEAVGAAVSTDNIRESVRVILDSGIPYQFRTTLVKSLCSPEDIPDVLSLIQDADHYVLQKFQPSEKILDQSLFEKDQYTDTEFQGLKARWEKSLSRAL